MGTINTNGEYRHDKLAVLAAMLWPLPEQEPRRTQFAAVTTVKDLLGNGDQELTLSADVLATVLHAPSWADLGREVEEQTRKATIAGYVMAFMFAMDRYANKMPRRGEAGGSLDKAFFCATAWAREGHTYRDGSPIQASEGRVKKCWQEFRSVAHLWGAKELNKGVQAVPPQGIFDEQHLPTFLGAAAYLQCYGLSRELTHKSRSAADTPTLLNASDTWLLDTGRFRPRIMLPDDDEHVVQAPFVQFLKRYEAARKN